jgi:hypothetical protein
MNFPFTPFQLEWLAALKSGRFLQGRERLTTLVEGKHLHCCLGVACALHNELAASLKLEPLKVIEAFRGILYDEFSEYLPPSITERLFLISDSGHFRNKVEIEGRVYYSLASMNDGCISFAEIAAYIEANPENVFTNKTN